MILVSIANKDEWKSTKEYYQDININNYPFGEYFIKGINNYEVLFFYTGVRKTNASASTQYMIDHFDTDKIIVIGTCCGISKDVNIYDLVIPNLAVQTDCTVREIEPLIREKYNVSINVPGLSFPYKKGIIATQDKPIVMEEDYNYLIKNNITVCDTEAASIAYIAKINNIDVLIIKGVSDTIVNKKDINISYQEQYEIFVKNIPIVMNKILDNLERIIK
jgi:nucleoside phosphorylase